MEHKKAKNRFATLRAYEIGFDAGFNKDSKARNPYKDNSDEYHLWEDGVKDGKDKYKSMQPRIPQQIVA